MAKEIDHQSSFKRLPAFTYNRKIQLKKTDINDVAGALISSLPRYIEDKGVKIEFNLTNERLNIMADTLRMQEALLNLIKNSLDAMPFGGALTIGTKKVNFNNGVYPQRNDKLSAMCAVCSVSDTGKGMDEATLRRALEPFFTSKMAAEQKGLGLPIAYHIIKEHSGSMSMESSPGRGTTIKLYLPLLGIGPERIEPIPLPPLAGTRLMFDRTTFGEHDNGQASL
jgi:two-component system, cell cycle sensor histidine kinase and response regulator CckA